MEITAISFAVDFKSTDRSKTSIPGFSPKALWLKPLASMIILSVS